MASIYTSTTQSGKDMVTKEAPLQTEDFLTTFNTVMKKLQYINSINDKTSFNIELNKLRKKMRTLIREHFEVSLQGLSSEKQFEEKVEIFKNDIKDILKQIQ